MMYSLIPQRETVSLGLGIVWALGSMGHMLWGSRGRGTQGSPIRATVHISQIMNDKYYTGKPYGKEHGNYKETGIIGDSRD